MNPKVDGYIRKNNQWRAELEALREIVLSCDLIEEIKWRAPCYTLDGANIVLMGSYKDAAVLSFLKGSLLKDAKGLLVSPGKNTQAARFMKFTTAADVNKHKATIKAYIKEAIKIERDGLKVDFKAKDELVYPDELLAKFKEDAALEKAFMALTPGRQRAFIMHFNDAKQSKTRRSRIEKWTPTILEGKGMMDDYRKTRRK